MKTALGKAALTYIIGPHDCSFFKAQTSPGATFSTRAPSRLTKARTNLHKKSSENVLKLHN